MIDSVLPTDRSKPIVLGLLLVLVLGPSKFAPAANDGRTGPSGMLVRTALACQVVFETRFTFRNNLVQLTAISVSSGRAIRPDTRTCEDLRTALGRIEGRATLSNI